MGPEKKISREELEQIIKEFEEDRIHGFYHHFVEPEEKNSMNEANSFGPKPGRRDDLFIPAKKVSADEEIIKLN